MSVAASTVGSLAPASRERGNSKVNRRRLTLSSWVYLPGCSIVIMPAVLVGIGWAYHWGGSDFVGSMASLRVVVVGPMTLVLIGLFLIVERVRPAQRRPLFRRGYRH